MSWLSFGSWSALGTLSWLTVATLRLLSEAGAAGDDQAVQIAAAYELVFFRQPTSAELERATQFLSQQVSDETADDKQQAARKQSLSQLIHVLFASTEFRIQG